MKPTPPFYLLFLLLLLHGTVLGSGKVRGTILDKATKEPLVGANIVVLGTSFGGAADTHGEFTIPDLPSGTYSLTGRYVGYTPVTITNVRVLNDLTTEVRFELPAEVVNLEGITIVAERPLINKSATNAMRVLTGDEIRSIPVRGVDNLLALQAGVVLQDGSAHIRGGRVDEVGYYLEGVAVTEPQYGGRGISLTQDALEEMSVQSAGYNAEYGRANSGIVQYQLKSGGSELKAMADYVTDNLSMAPKSKAFTGEKRLGTYWWGYNEFNGSLSGPLFTQQIRGFGLFNYTYNRDVNPQPYPGVNVGLLKDPVSGASIYWQYPAGPRMKNSAERYSYIATLTADFRPLLLRFSGSYAKTVMFSSSPFDFLDLARAPENDIWNGFWSAKATYFFGPSTFLEVTGGLFYYSSKTLDPVLRDDFFAYGDSVANAEAGFIWQRTGPESMGRYVVPSYTSIYDAYFSPPGLPLSGYLKLVRNNLSLNAAFSTQLGRVHTLKLGGDYQRYTIRTYQQGYPQALIGQIAANNARPDGDPLKVTTEDILRLDGTNTYGYDLFGNQYDGDDYLGPRHPVFASAYVEDKMEFSDLIFNAGLRYDYLNSNAYTLVDPTHPELAFDFYTGVVNPAGLKKATAYQSVSPRLGVAFPVSDQTVFHVQFARLLQEARLRDVNVGLYAFMNMILVGTSSYPIGLELRPTSTTQYEIGFRQQIGSFAAFDITGYYKDIKDQIVMGLVQSAAGTGAGNYAVFVNGDFATTKGVELTFNMRRQNRVLASASLSFQDARGSGSYPNSDWAIVTGIGGSQNFTPQYVAPLSYDNSVRGNVNLDYRFGRDDGGPILQQLGASLLFTFHSGHPYTRTATPVNGQLAIEPLNSSTTPWVFQLDMKVDKTFRVLGLLDLDLYVYIINVLDTRNIENVFSNTGSPSDDGYISDPTSGGKVVQEYGPTYAAVYNAFLNYSNPTYFSRVYPFSSQMQTFPSFYGPPRQIRIGVRLEY